MERACLHISSGEIVPDVMTTELNFSKIGAIASEGSRQTKWKMGFATVAVSVSYGSRISKNPDWFKQGTRSA